MKKKSTTLWILAFIITLLSAYYQRKTGPTYPVRDQIMFGNEKIKYKLPRTEGEKDARIELPVADTAVHAVIEYKRLNVQEDMTIVPMNRQGEMLVGHLPMQPPAGKLSYKVFLLKGNEKMALTVEPVNIRFKGDVPAYILIPHVIFMFLAMMFSFRAGLEVIFKGNNSYRLTFITILLLGAGGMILGPIVQKFAFGAYWTGWPFGQDLTDNKTLVAFVFWLIAFFRLKKNRKNTGWVIIASVVLLLVYLVPHSMFGSQLDYSTGNVNTGK